MKRFGKIYNAIEEWTSGLLIFIGLFLLFVNVLGRYIFNFSFTWVEEVSIYMVVWGTLIGASVALRTNHHIRVDIVYNFLPASIKSFVSVIANLVGVSFAIFVLYYGFDLVHSRFLNGMKSTGSLIPLWIVYLILPIFGLLMLFQFSIRIIRIFRGLPESDEDDNPELAQALQQGQEVSLK